MFTECLSASEYTDIYLIRFSQHWYVVGSGRKGQRQSKALDAIQSGHLSDMSMLYGCQENGALVLSLLEEGL